MIGIRITKFSCTGFRNLEKTEIEPSEEVNIICGDNGQGKTNLIEGIALFSGVRSFRGAHNRQMIRDEEDFARLETEFFAEKRDQNAALVLTPDKKELTLNGVKQAAASAMIGKFCCVVFSPDRMSLITGGAIERRHFLDAAISQCYPRFVPVLYSYNQTVNQRNALLKQIASGEADKRGLELWDMYAAGYAAEIALRRSAYCKSLSEKAKRIYDGISAGREDMSVEYSCSYMSEGDGKEEIIQRFIKTLRESWDKDIALGYTLRGPQRDDIIIKLSGKDIRPYGSQGQKRSAVLALKLAEAEYLSELIEEKPIALLDDVMSELDKSRQAYLLNRLDGWQVYITCCDPAPLKLLDKGKIYNVEKGRVTVR